MVNVQELGLLVYVKSHAKFLHTTQFIFLGCKTSSSTLLDQDNYIGQLCKHANAYKLSRAQPIFKVVKGKDLNGRTFKKNI